MAYGCAAAGIGPNVAANVPSALIGAFCVPPFTVIETLPVGTTASRPMRPDRTVETGGLSSTVADRRSLNNGVAFATSNDRSTTGAALWFASPSCEALIVTVPTPVIWTLLPKTVAGPETTLNVTGNPDEAV